MTRFRLLLGDRHGMLATLAIGSVLAGLAESTILAISAQVAAALVAGTSAVKVEIGSLTLTETIDTLLLIALAVAVVRLALQWMVSIPPARIAAAMQTGLRRDLLSAFTEASWSEQSSDREGHLQELATSQASQTTQGTVQAAALVSGLTSLLVLVVSALVLNALAAVTVLVAAVALFALLRPLSTLSSRRARELSLAAIEYAGGVSESIRLSQETQVFGTGDAVRGRIDRLIDRLGELYFHTLLLARLVPGIYQSLIYLLVIAALIGLNAANVSHVASLGAVVLLLVRAGTYGQQVQSTYQGVRQALPYFDRVKEAQQRYRESVPPDGERALEPVRALAFEHVDFAYEPGQPTLRDVSFEIGAGEAIGAIGPSGAGKSTVVQILLALRPPDAGEYTINGVPAAEYRRADLHRAIAYVPQEPRLLHATVAENIRYYRPIGDEAVEEAARLAGIHDVVAAWPKGYETIVGPRADAVSGGQQQRICLARALAARPEVLVLDEPTSALDPHSEQLIQESLMALKHRLTLFIVAHRMSTLDICERVMVILDGRLAAFDTAAALEASNPYYRSSLAIGATASGGG